MAGSRLPGHNQRTMHNSSSAIGIFDSISLLEQTDCILVLNRWQSKKAIHSLCAIKIDPDWGFAWIFEFKEFFDGRFYFFLDSEASCLLAGVSSSSMKNPSLI